ncbi:hypothetical protein GcM3_009036 [Golovinomyces cichoracearum]|uniref:Ca2+-modulated nonselective cation channel polycystin n=1 Tax=Golovinomyces cichoracearum TaxID=62708 RepID=A0A420JAA6_9PEZI|nr:hypothetical protein GcM3_009036 [Golovinomyces cichoracearum]
MTTAVIINSPESAERPSRRRPFSSWMKKLANLKPGSSGASDNNQTTSKKRIASTVKPYSKKSNFSKNINLYSGSPCVNEKSGPENCNNSSSTIPSTSHARAPSGHEDAVRYSEDDLPPSTIGNKSTTETSAGQADSVVAPSQTLSSGQGTNGTVGFGQRGNDSTFSSPAPSVRSLTTLNTLHSTAPTATTTNVPINGPSTNHVAIHFSHQFPSSSPLNALPSHLAPQSSGGHPSTYNTATANNLLTDNASILTLASSSKRRRRRSIDTDASVRALAPSSLFGGSRESLPLSVLSGNIDPSPHQQRPSLGGLNERGSMYSVAGVASVLSGERISYYAGKQQATADSGGLMQSSSPASPRDPVSSAPKIQSQTEINRDEELVSTEIKESDNHIS